MARDWLGGSQRFGDWLIAVHLFQIEVGFTGLRSNLGDIILEVLGRDQDKILTFSSNRIITFVSYDQAIIVMFSFVRLET